MNEIKKLRIMETTITLLPASEVLGGAARSVYDLEHDTLLECVRNADNNSLFFNEIRHNGRVICQLIN